MFMGFIQRCSSMLSTFDEIWYEIEDLLYGNLMIAHNASLMREFCAVALIIGNFQA